MRWLFAAPFLILLVLFALSNRQSARLELWPTDWSVEAPLAIVVLGTAAFAFLLGALTVWLSEIRRRRQLRQTERAVQMLEDQVSELKAAAGRSPLPPPT
jgi:uncharacterized integral membrane protein